MAQLFIESLESVNEIDDSFSRVGASGLGTEMGAAPEGTVGINRATAIRAEQGAGSGRVWLQACASRCPDTFGCVKSLSMGHQWHPSAGSMHARSAFARSLHRWPSVQAQNRIWFVFGLAFPCITHARVSDVANQKARVEGAEYGLKLESPALGC